MLEPLCEQAEPGAVPVDDLDQVRSGAAPEHEEVAGERVLLKYALHQHGEAIDALAHVDEAQGQVHLYVWWEHGRHDKASAAPALSVICTVTKVGAVSAASSRRHR